MSFDGPVGEMRETCCEKWMDWSLKDFFSWSQNGRKVVNYYSELYSFAGCAWYLKLCSNENEPSEKRKWYGFGLYRNNVGLNINLTIKAGLRQKSGHVEHVLLTNFTFRGIERGYRTPEFFPKSELLNRKDDLAPEDTLTLVCVLSHYNPEPIRSSPFSRLQTMTFQYLDILRKGLYADVLLKVDGEHYHAHKAILSSQSPVFAAMFKHDMQESRQGSVEIKNIEGSIFKQLLAYIYSGEPEGLTPENVCRLFTAADMYGLKDLMTFCVEFMKDNLSAEILFDVLAIANMHKDEKLETFVLNYFVANFTEITKTEMWENFKRENGPLAHELTESARLELKERSRSQTSAMEEEDYVEILLI